MSQDADRALLASIGNAEWLKTHSIGATRWNAIVNGTAPDTRVTGRSESAPSAPTTVPYVTREEMTELVRLAVHFGIILDPVLVEASLGSQEALIPAPVTPPSPLYPVVTPPPANPMTWRTNEPDIGSILPRPVYWAYNQIPASCPRCGSAGHSIWFAFDALIEPADATPEQPAGRHAVCFVCRKFTFTVLQTEPSGPPERRSHPRSAAGRT